MASLTGQKHHPQFDHKEYGLPGDKMPVFTDLMEIAEVRVVSAHGLRQYSDSGSAHVMDLKFSFDRIA
ncbi:hypothetical protein QA646_27225 (plasmid) [Rhizobium sp. CB3090]|uniref:hypothetical protein n=1 Tax=Rhizobium sp. CB3090 TaxID=3039156 RepID=UPI0024B1ABF2|nr:hypothetical protein [Rhizobium sp. CB3090]WFU13050.1 hypothetical protein QA646_27225 [Rhizobium sp. CB3090]